MQNVIEMELYITDKANHELVNSEVEFSFFSHAIGDMVAIGSYNHNMCNSLYEYTTSFTM